MLCLLVGFLQRLITCLFYFNADERDRPQDQHNIAAANGGSHSLAILFLLVWSHVVPSHQQYMPPYLLPLQTNGLHYATARLHRHYCPHCHLLLSSSLLLFPMRTLLLPPLHGLHHSLWVGHHLGLPRACVPDRRVPVRESWAILLHGSIRTGAHDA